MSGGGGETYAEAAAKDAAAYEEGLTDEELKER